MKIWRLKSDLEEHFEDLHLVDFDRDEHFFDAFDLPKKDWSPIEVYTYEEGEPSDCPHFWGRGEIPVFTEHARNILQDLTEDQVQFLPLVHPERSYYAVHVFNVLDAIDYQKSVIETLSSGLRFDFEKYSFIKERVLNEHIFKVYLDKRVFLSVFVSDPFRERVLSHGLAGFNFVEVWDWNHS